MALNLGQILGGAGIVATRMREAEESERVAQQNQLKIEEQNRLARMKAQIAQRPLPSLTDVEAGAPYAGLPMFEFQQPMPQRQMAAPVAPTPPLPDYTLEDLAPGRTGVAAQPRMVQMTGPAPAMVPVIEGASPEQMRKAQENYAFHAMRLRDAVVGLENLRARGNVPERMIKNQEQLVERQRQQLQFAQEGLSRLSPGAQTFPVAPQGTVPTPQQVSDEFARIGAPAAPVAPAAAPASRATQQYDAAVTPYDALIQQSAQQAGIDPVMFKRLLGSESSFNPSAVSPRGEKFGLGIAQIADVHKLTREQRLDPNTAIPFAAQLFSQYLREAGGDYNAALMRYKGATSERGRTEMAPVIQAITAGLVPSAAAAPAAAAPVAAAAAAPVTAPPAAPILEPAVTASPVAQNTANAVLAATPQMLQTNPEQLSRVIRDTQEFAARQRIMAVQQRNDQAALARIYMSSGTADGITQGRQLMADIGKMDMALMQFDKQMRDSIIYMQGMEGLQEFARTNNPSRLAGVWSYFSPAPVGLQQRSDGMFDLFYNGQRSQEGLSKDQVQQLAQQAMFESAREAIAKSATLENELALKQKYGDARVNAMKDIWVAIINGQAKIAEENAKNLNGKLTVDAANQGAWLQTPQGTFFLSKGGIVETPAGAVTPVTAQRVQIPGR